MPESERENTDEHRNKELWRSLVEARHTSGLTQSEVAKRLGVSQAQVARIEKRGNEDFRLSTLQRYVQALGEGYALEIHVQLPHTYSTGSSGLEIGNSNRIPSNLRRTL